MKLGLQLGGKYGYSKVLFTSFIVCSAAVYASSYTENIFSKFSHYGSLCSVVLFGFWIDGRPYLHDSHENLQ